MKRARAAIAAWSVLGILGVLSPFMAVDASDDGAPAPPRPYLLLDAMHQFQRYADKLYFSGKTQNWELAGWYLWKLEAAALPVIEGRVERYRSERYDAQPLMKAMLIPAIRNVEKTIEAKQDADFQRAYIALVATCNACHAATEHAFVKIIVPTTPIYSNQEYRP
jgi:hypothetical protein